MSFVVEIQTPSLSRITTTTTTDNDGDSKK